MIAILLACTASPAQAMWHGAKVSHGETSASGGTVGGDVTINITINNAAASNGPSWQWCYGHGAPTHEYTEKCK